MKRLFSAIILGVSIITFGAVLSGCAEEMVDINDEISLGRCLTPTELSAKIIDGEFIEFSWTKSKGATEFVLELYTDEQMTGSPVETFVIPAADIPYTADLEADMVYYARVKGVNADGVIADSNWAVYDRPLQTYAIKSSLNPELVDRTESSITIKWTKDPEVDHIRVTPALNAEEEYTRFDVDASAADAAKVEVTGLKSSVNYTLAVHFKSAQRGTVSAWTRPSVSGAVEANSTAAIQQAILDGAAVIKVAYADTAYNIGNVTLAGPVAIYGDAKSDGTNPTIAGTFSTADAVTSIHLEALNLEGMASTYGHLITINAVNAMTKVSVINCKIANFGKGIYYDNKGASVDEILWDGNYIENIEGNGGDVFDVRQTSSLPSIIFKNTTMTIGGRTYFRIDANATVGSFKMENCTLNNLCFANNGNNNGVFNIRAAITDFIFKDNVVLNMQDENKRCCLIAKNSTSAFPTEIANNFFYNCYDRFFVAQKDGSSLSGDELTDAAAEGRARILVNGSVELADDPCVDSGRDKYNVTNPQVLDAQAGDPRWYSVYVEIPEDLTQEVTATGKVWNLTDGQTFKKLADKDMVRDGIRFYVKNTPVNFVENGFEFSGAATVGEDGIPTDGAIGIKVNEPGSIVISAAEASGHSNLTVSLDGKISAAVPAGAEFQKVTFANISGEQMIYIYGCHPATMTFLQWTSDIQVLDNVLATPVVSIDKKVVNERAEETITLTWDPIDYAASYNVTVDGKTKNVTETTYSFETAAFSVEEEGGDFAILVTAVPADDDYIREESAPAELSFHVNDVPVADTGEIVDPTAITETYFKNLVTDEGFESQAIASGAGSLTIDKLTFGDNSEFDGKRYKHKGASALGEDGIPTDRYVSFKITRPGTISHKVISGSSSAADRAYVVALVTNVGGVKSVRELYNQYAPTSSSSEPVTTEVTADMLAGITESAVVYIYTLANCNTYAVGYDPVPAAPTKVDLVWDFSAPEWVDAMTNSGVAQNTNDTNWDLEVNGLRVVSGGGSIKWNIANETVYYWQPGGKSNGTNRYFEFTTDLAGTVSVWSSNTGSSEDMTRMVTVQVGEGEPESLPGGTPSNADPTQNDFSVAPGTVKIYPTGNGLRFYKIEFHSN